MLKTVNKFRKTGSQANTPEVPGRTAAGFLLKLREENPLTTLFLPATVRTVSMSNRNEITTKLKSELTCGAGCD